MFYAVIPSKALSSVLTYASDAPLAPGTIVEVPLGRSRVAGVVVKKAPRPTFATKSILRPLATRPLPRHLLLAAQFIADYYAAPLGSVISTILPPGLTTHQRPAPSTSAKTAASVKTATTASAPSASNSASPPQAPPDPKALATPAAPTAPTAPAASPIPLNSAQQSALKSLRTTPGATKLLWGDTGSGKTNIYLAEALRVFSAGRSVIVLVPEIALTSQLVQIFRAQFGDAVVLLHSQQTPAARRRLFLASLATDAPQIVIGPRSALFAPVANLGLIVVDEEHEGAYYQENAPRYSAVRVASFLASSLSISCILGSATPNLVDFYVAQQRGTVVRLQGKAKALASPAATSAPTATSTATPTAATTTPAVPTASVTSASASPTPAPSSPTFTPTFRLIDLKDRTAFSKNRYFSNALLRSLKANLAAGRQTLIFHNRRGSAPLTICDACGTEIVCPECFLPLTLHADRYELVCHTCGFKLPVPSSCPQCGAPGLVHKGFGTKLLETELQKLFPQARIRRFDADNKKGETLAAVYNAVRAGAVDILVGTQTLAKGLDLPHLATVGVVQADAGLSLPCFSAEERTFQLLTQVIGRVGRGHLDAAEVIVQTFRPDHPLFSFALRNDFQGFANYLLAKRREAGFPPFCFVAQVSCTLKTEHLTLSKVRTLASRLASDPRLIVSPPMPAFHEHTAKGYTWQLLVRSRSRQHLLTALSGLDRSLKATFDPPSLL